MIFIAHRGNTKGRNLETENSPDAIIEAAKLHMVEVDVRLIGGTIVFGHDMPMDEVSYDFIYSLSQRLLIHCKNVDAVRYFMFHPEFHFFWHQNDDYTITSKGKLFTKPGSPIIDGSIVVMPEMASYTVDELRRADAICTDKVDEYMEKIKA